MKKRIYKLLALVLVLGSCNIDRFPKGSIDRDQIIKDPDTYMKNVMNGCYASLKTWSDPMHRCGEYAGDNINIRSTSSDAFFEFITYVRTPDNWRLTSFWNESYRVIANVSNTIKMFEEGTSEVVDNNLAECYFMRGTLYFYLARAFGRPYAQNPETNLGVPIVNGTPEDPLVQLPDRSTVQATYSQAIQDLKKAEELFNKNAGPIRGSKEAAQAILSRVYLFMSGTYETPNADYAQLAVEYATKVIDSGSYSLLPREKFMKYNEEIPEKNPETIFAIKRLDSEFSGGDYYYTVGGMYATIDGVGWGEMYASQKYIDLLNETGRNDWRPDSYNIVDARAAFIRPKYDTDDDGNIVTDKVFRFVEHSYPKQKDLTEDNLLGYSYQQLKVVPKNGKLYAQLERIIYSSNLNEKGQLIPEKVTVDGKEEDKKELIEYELIPVNEEQGVYRIAQYNTSNNQSPIYIEVEGMIDYFIRTNNSYPMFYVIKSSLEGGISHLHSPVLVRLGEVYLNRAEALAKLGKYGEALADLNKIRTRSIPGGAYASLDQVTASDRIDKERQLELAFQAERSYDVFRNGKPLERKYPGAHNGLEVVPATDFRTTYFIPKKAIDDYNGTLTQNPISN